MGDTSRALSNGVANVGINPTPNVNLQALLNSIKKQRPLLSYLRSMQGRNKSATYEAVLDFHVLVEILGTPSTYLITNLLHIGRFQQ